MRAHTSRWMAWAVCGLSIALAFVGPLLSAGASATHPEFDYGLPFSIAFLGFTVVGALIAWRQPHSLIGWLLLAQGLCWELSGALAGYANRALLLRTSDLPGGEIAAWMLNWLYLPALGAMTALFLVFPDARLPSRRWIRVVWLGAIGFVLAFTASAIAPGPMNAVPSVVNPFGIETLAAPLGIAQWAGNLMFALAAGASVVSQIFRFRNSNGPERQQLKWLALAALLVLFAFTTYDVLNAMGLSALAENIGPPSVLAIPVAVGVAVLRYRLFDIDVAVSKTLVFGGLAAAITVGYLAVVAGIGGTVGRVSNSNVYLAVVATALMAVAFQPLRAGLERLARRIVFGIPTPEESYAGVVIYSLGAFRVVREGGVVPLNAWQSKKARTLLKILISRRGRATTRDFLMEAMWPEEDPDLATRRLSVALATVRAVLDPEKRHPSDHFIIGDKDALRLNLTNLPVDVEKFMAFAHEGLDLYRGGENATAGIALAKAEREYGGDFLEEDSYEGWAVPLREETRMMLMSVLRLQATLAADAGDVDDAIRHYLRILDKDPWDEGAHVALVAALAGAGRHGEARRCYRTYAMRMDEIELPVAPFPSSSRA